MNFIVRLRIILTQKKKMNHQNIFITKSWVYLRIPSAIMTWVCVYSYSGSERSSSCFHLPVSTCVPGHKLLHFSSLSSTEPPQPASSAWKPGWPSRLNSQSPELFVCCLLLHLTGLWTVVRSGQVYRQAPSQFRGQTRRGGRAAADESETCRSEELCDWAQTPSSRQNKAKTRLSRGFTSITRIDKKRE